MKTTPYMKLEKRVCDAIEHDPKFGDLSWYVEQEFKIREADVRDAMARRSRQAEIDEGHLYVVEFTSGVVKVGKSVSPVSRLASHAKYAQIHGGDIRQSWVSERHRGYSSTERELIDFCDTRGSRVFGKEYFRWVTFAATRDYADLLTRLADEQQMHESYGKTVDLVRESLSTMREGAGGDEHANAVEAWDAATDGGPDDPDVPDDEPADGEDTPDG